MKSYFLILFSGLVSSFIFLNNGWAHCPEKFNESVEYRLFFGRNNSKGKEVVKDKDWENFLASTITPLFPNGLTIYDSKGQWKNSSGRIIQEKSKIVLILTNSQAASTSIYKITTTYKKLFQQESVMTLVNCTCVAF